VKLRVRKMALFFFAALALFSAVAVGEGQVQFRGSDIAIPIYIGFSSTSHQGKGLEGSPRALIGLAFGAGIEYVASSWFSMNLDVILTCIEELRPREHHERDHSLQSELLGISSEAQILAAGFRCFYVGPYLG